MTKTLVLKRWFDVSDFDYDGGGDYTYTDVDWTEFKSESELLKYLQDNICGDGDYKPRKFKTIKDYTDTYGFQVYERVY